MHYLDELLNKAVECQAQDIHIQPPCHSGADMTVLFRQSRQLRGTLILQFEAWRPLCSYLQFHSGYAYEASDCFQDRMLEYQQHFLRIAFTPGRNPYITIRLAQKESCPFIYPLELEEYLEKWQTYGGFLILAGPIHSGKTTLYYECLERAYQSGATLSSWEDPIEKHIPHLNQQFLAPERWSELALAALRFDWDVVGIGEIRSLDHLEQLIFLSLSSVRTVTTMHASSIMALRSKMKSLSIVLQEQLKEVSCGVIFRSHKGALEWDELF